MKYWKIRVTGDCSLTSGSVAAVKSVQARRGRGGEQFRTVWVVWAVWAVCTAGSLLYRAGAAGRDAAAASSTWDVYKRTS